MKAKSIQEWRRDLQVELNPFFYPDSIAIIGASQNLVKPSGIPLNLLTMFDYGGEVYPVNPKYEQLGGWKCYPSIMDTPGPVDLAIIGVPAAATMEALYQCVSKGVKAGGRSRRRCGGWPKARVCAFLAPTALER